MDALFLRPPPHSSLLAVPSPSIFAGLDVRACHNHHQHPSPPGVTGRSPRQAEPPLLQVTVPRHPYMFPRPLRRLLPRREEDDAGGEAFEAEEDEVPLAVPGRRRRKGNWVLKILRVSLIWEKERKSGGDESSESGEEEEEREAVNSMLDQGDRCVGCCGDDDCSEGCDVGDEEEEGEVEVDRDSFSRLLRPVSLADTELYEKMSHLGSLAYNISRIKPENLWKRHKLSFVTSSLEKKLNSSNAELEQAADHKKDKKEVEREDRVEETESGKKNQFSAAGAYHIAASAASYVQSQAKNILPFGQVKTSGKGSDSPERGDRNEDESEIANLEKASFVVTTGSVTAVVAAKEEVKEAVANDLNSSRTSPCEWFICDDERNGTRYFVIQGSESLASWQANLLFEPIQFEGLEVLVHRGIYEAAKGIYEQMLPEIQAHLESRGSSATFRFTGHSLGGSLSLLVNLMLLIRGKAPASSLLPVVTFGAPSIMCGGNYLLQKLGLPRSHVQAITLHRDIVPRAFSCTYPERVADILKAVNGNFRNHPCLKHRKLLYEPMGEILILQPDENFSPHHPLLPSGIGLYYFGSSSPETSYSRRLLRAAQSVFLNSPHPLEILSDRSAYGADGAVTRDHDMSSYLKSLRHVILLERKRIRRARREQRRGEYWPLVTTENGGSRQISVSTIMLSGKESLERFTRQIGSHNTHILVVFLLPARMLLLQALNVICFS